MSHERNDGLERPIDAALREQYEPREQPPLSRSEVEAIEKTAPLPFKRGDIVECVDADNSNCFLVFGKRHTVVSCRFNCFDGAAEVNLMGLEPPWRANRFRLVGPGGKVGQS